MKLFFEKFCPIRDIEFSNCSVHREYTVINGRPDIYINDGSEFGAIIENKINAGEQDEQLERYKKFLVDKHGMKHCLFFLTPNGRPPTSIKNKDDCKCLSYEKDILDWLELCQKEVCNKPIIRETLTQYILLIKQLTGQARSERMAEEYYEVITKDRKNLVAAFDIANSISMTIKRIMEKEIVPLMKSLSIENEVEFEYDDYDKQYGGFTFFKKEYKHFEIAFQFQKNNFKELLCGCWSKEWEKNKNNDLLKKILTDVSIMHNVTMSKYGPCVYDVMDGCYRNWDKDFFVKLLDNEGKTEVRKTFDDKIKKMLPIIKSIEKQIMNNSSAT